MAPLLTLLLLTVTTAAFAQTYTSTRFLYAVDYPSKWKVKEIGQVTTFLSPLESKDDKFAENVTVVVEDLSQIEPPVSLFDYHRKAVNGAPASLAEFKMLEEAKTRFIGRDAIAVLYTAKIRGEQFRFKAYTIMANRTAYVLTYTARSADFDQFLPPAEKLMRSLRV